jgi:hypothetical protein
LIRVIAKEQVMNRSWLGVCTVAVLFAAFALPAGAAEYKHPGVYVEEAPSRTKPIEGVSSTSPSFLIVADIGKAQVKPTGAAAMIGPGMQRDTNYFGSDYRNIDNITAAQCQAACKNESQCKAWTWVKPGVQGPQAKCWLKNAVPAKSANTCCISGVDVKGAPSAVLTEQGAEGLVQQGILQPEVLSINNQRPAGFVLRPGTDVALHGHGLGTGGQLRLLGGFRKTPPLIVKEWRPSVISARLPDDISGEEDFDNVRIEIQPTGKAPIVVPGVRFEAAREVSLLKAIPQPFAKLETRHTRTIFTDGSKRPSTKDEYPQIAQFIRDVPAQSVIVIRSTDGPYAKWFSPGHDRYDLPLRQGFAIKRYEFWHGRTDTHASRCGSDAGGQYFQGRYDAAVEGRNIVNVVWGVWRCHTSFGVVNVEWDLNFSSYGLNIYVEGPRGVSPFINPLLK